MKKQRRRQIVSTALAGLCLAQASVLSGCSEKALNQEKGTGSKV